MQFWFVISLFFSVIVAIFAVQNSDVVKIDMFWYTRELSQSLIILISTAFGALITIFLGLFSKIKSSLKIRSLTNDLKAAEKKIELLNSSVKSYEQKAAAASEEASAAAAKTAEGPAEDSRENDSGSAGIPAEKNTPYGK